MFAEDRAKLVERLDRDHLRVTVDEDLRQLARARTQIEHRRIGIDRQQVKDRRRPARASALVFGRGEAERSILLDQLTPASKNARFSFSISRAITRRWI